MTLLSNIMKSCFGSGAHPGSDENTYNIYKYNYIHVYIYIYLIIFIHICTCICIHI